jgi:hypothetical protein
VTRRLSLSLLVGAIAMTATTVKTAEIENPIKPPKRGSFAEQRMKDKARKMERKTRK